MKSICNAAAFIIHAVNAAAILSTVLTIVLR